MTILIIVLILISIPFILALFMPEGYLIEKQITINRPNQAVYDYIKMLRNSSNYNKWVMMDPNMKKEYRGTDGTVGFVYTWDSTNRNVGQGEQEIIKLLDGQRVDYEIRFIRPFQGVSYAWLTTESTSPNQTIVNWSFRGMRNYTMKVMHNVLNLKKILGRDLQTSLNNLKSVLEKQ
jgi:Polyketide cyclase / dehydrase and lipid transport